jgi:ABC-2 type transport system ATP-binding protein
MDEAQYLADRVAIIRDGLIIAEGAPNELGGRAERASAIRFLLPPGVSAGDLPDGVGRIESELRGAGVALATDDPVRTLNILTGWAMERGCELSGLEVTRPSLEDMYLELTDEAPA